MGGGLLIFFAAHEMSGAHPMIINMIGYFATILLIYKKPLTLIIILSKKLG